MSAETKSVSGIVAGLDLEQRVEAVLQQLGEGAQELMLQDLRVLATWSAIPVLQADVDRRLEELRKEALAVEGRLAELERELRAATVDHQKADAALQDVGVAKAREMFSAPVREQYQQALAAFKAAEARLDRIRREQRALGRGRVGTLATLRALIAHLEALQAYLAALEPPRPQLLPAVLERLSRYMDDR